MTRHFKNASAPLFGLLTLVLVLPSAGCDPLEPPRLPVGDTAVLHSLARAEYIGEWSGFDFVTPRPVLIERPREAREGAIDFDVAFSELDGEFVMLPAGVFETFQIEPGIAVDSGGVTFEELSRAPSEGYVADTGVVVREGPVYIVRTRQARSGCTQYAKFEVLDLDPAGIIEFRYLRNNLCNDRNLTDVEID